MRRALFSFALIAGLLVSVAAQEKSAVVTDAKFTLTVTDFGDAGDKKIRDEAVSRFKLKYPNVDVVLNFTPITTWADYIDKLLVQSASSKKPDLIHLATEGVQLAVNKKLFVPLDDLLASPDGKAMLADFDPAILDSMKIGGKQYLVPAAWNNMLIYVNTAMFKKYNIPLPATDWTWDDFIATAKKLTNKSSGEWGFGIPFFQFGLIPWFYSNGTSPLNEELTASNLKDPKVAETVQFIRDLVYKYEVSPSVASTDPNAVYNLFATGKIGMAGGGHWPMQFFMANNFKDFDVVKWPKKSSSTTVFGVDGWGITQSSKNRAAAFDLLREFTSVQTLTATTTAGVAIPARRSVANTPAFLAQPASARLFYESLGWAKPVPAPKNYNEYDTILMRYLNLIMSDSVTVKDGLAKADAELTQAMKRVK